MSLDQAIADLQSQTGQLLDLPQTIADAATAQIAAVGQQYQQNLNSQSVTFHIDAVTGGDDNSGAHAHPFKTLQAAVDRVPRGGYGLLLLQSAVAIDGLSVVIDGRDIQLASATGQRLSVTGTASVDPAAGHRRCHGFEISFGARLAFSGLTLTIPTAAGAVAAAPEHQTGGFIHASGTIAEAGNGVSIAFCDVDFPAEPVGKVADFGGAPFYLHWESNVVSGTMNGNLVRGADSAGGTSAAGVPGLLTNLTTL